MSVELLEFTPTDRALGAAARGANPCLQYDAGGNLVYGAHTDSCVMAAEITERELGFNDWMLDTRCRS